MSSIPGWILVIALFLLVGSTMYFTLKPNRHEQPQDKAKKAKT